LLAVANLWRNRRETRRRLLLVSIPLVLLVIVCIPAVGYVALGTLEWPYPRISVPAQPEVLVVLSGYLRGPDDDHPRVELGEDTLNRCQHAVSIYKLCKGSRILVSGGMSENVPEGPRLAEVMLDFLLDQGVQRTDLILENLSRDTHENAVESSKLLRHRGIDRIVLITDARHMFRAARCFEKEGVQVTPAPCNYVTTKFRNRWTSYLPSINGAARFQEAFHEWLGLAYYWVRGWI
jgi:uncharacterized SAM-binding protein YcdF (DUF218 family)